jgi:protein-disulfide isomerase
MDESAQEFSKRELKKMRKEEEKNKEQKSKTGKNLFTILAIFGVIALVGYGLLKISDPETSFSKPLSLPVEEIDNVKGAENPTVIMVEYGDYNCPGCASFAPIVEQAVTQFPDDLRLAYRHMPLPQYASSPIAAAVAEAAGKQGKFWEMHNGLYAMQEEWKHLENPVAQFEQYAEEMNLDMEKFKADFASEEIANKVERDAQSALDSDVNSTPTFFINGKKVERLPSSPQQFFDLIQAEIDEVKSAQ